MYSANVIGPWSRIAASGARRRTLHRPCAAVSAPGRPLGDTWEDGRRERADPTRGVGGRGPRRRPTAPRSWWWNAARRAGSWRPTSSSRAAPSTMRTRRWRGRWFGDDDARGAGRRGPGTGRGSGRGGHGGRPGQRPDHRSLGHACTLRRQPPTSWRNCVTGSRPTMCRCGSMLATTRCARRIGLEPVPDGAEAAAAWWVSPARPCWSEWEQGEAKLYWPTWYTVTKPGGVRRRRRALRVPVRRPRTHRRRGRTPAAFGVLGGLIECSV